MVTSVVTKKNRLRYNGYEVVKSHDAPLSEGIWHIERKEEELKLLRENLQFYGKKYKYL